MSSYAVVAAISTGLNKMKTVKEFLVKNRLPSIIDVNFEMGGSYYIIEVMLCGGPLVWFLFSSIQTGSTN